MKQAFLKLKYKIVTMYIFSKNGKYINK